MVHTNGSTTEEATIIMSDAQLKVKRLSENAFLPTRGSKQAAGYDLYSACDCAVPARGKNMVCLFVDLIYF